VFDQFKLINKFRNWLILFLAAVVIRNILLPISVNVFSFNGFINLLPFFVLGCGIQRFNNIFSGKELIKISVIAFVFSFAIQQYIWFADLDLSYYYEQLLSVFVACSGIIVLFFIRKNIPFMSKIGYYAFGIYLYHVMGTAGSRIILTKFGVEQHMILFGIGLLFGLGLPILIELIFEKSKITRRLFLGMK
jgi:hypothetical protein